MALIAAGSRRLSYLIKMCNWMESSKNFSFKCLWSVNWMKYVKGKFVFWDIFAKGCVKGFLPCNRGEQNRTTEQTRLTQFYVVGKNSLIKLILVQQNNQFCFKMAKICPVNGEIWLKMKLKNHAMIIVWISWNAFKLCNQEDFC